jgi:hypothetical protein
MVRLSNHIPTAHFHYPLILIFRVSSSLQSTPYMWGITLKLISGRLYKFKYFIKTSVIFRLQDPIRIASRQYRMLIHSSSYRSKGSLSQVHQRIHYSQDAYLN